MAILNSNKIVLSDTGFELENSVIIGHDFQGSIREISSAKLNMQINFFSTVEKWIESITNALNVEGFEKGKRRLIFDYPAASEQKVFYYFDLQLKAYLLELYPEWDAAKLIITTEPIVE